MKGDYLQSPTRTLLSPKKVGGEKLIVQLVYYRIILEKYKRMICIPLTQPSHLLLASGL